MAILSGISRVHVNRSLMAITPLHVSIINTRGRWYGTHVNPSCCGVDTSADFVVGVHFTALHIYTYATGKRFSGRSIWLMVDSVLSSIKKALSFVPKLSPKINNIDSGLKVIGYGSGQTKLCFLRRMTIECMRWRERRVVVLIQMKIVE
jgi:hypothetical protein